MNIVHLITRWIFIILISVLLLSGTIARAFNNLWIYENGFVKYDVSQALGISSAELNISASKLIAHKIKQLRCSTGALIGAHFRFRCFSYSLLLH
jgi:hypothetical protein